MSAALPAFLAISAVAGSPRLGPQPGVLLLRNGQVIEGQITRAGDLYYVTLPNGEIRIKAASVELCCRDLEEGYRQQRAAIQPGNVQDHLRLAQWCERHGLLGHAGRELADAIDADPTHPMIAVLERRLKAALEPPPRPAEPPKTTGSAAPVSAEELGRMVRGMPPRTVETFAQTVQPVLMNHCATAGCHGPGAESEYRLLRAAAGKPPSRLITQRNLHATLQWIDRADPDASRLLDAARSPHGTATAASFTDHQQLQYKRLVDWVRLVARQPAPQATSPTEAPATSAADTAPAQLPPESTDKARPIPVPPDEQPAEATPEGTLLTPAARVKRGASLPQFVPADQFDAEIFNREYHAER